MWLKNLCEFFFVVTNFFVWLSNSNTDSDSYSDGSKIVTKLKTQIVTELKN